MLKGMGILRCCLFFALLGTHGVWGEEKPARELAALGVPAWHAAGIKGHGVRVLILDTGFRGYQQHLGHALPTKVSTKSFRYDGDLEAKESSHGILCASIVHQIAPEASLYFANWEPDQPDTFMAALEWAQQQGVRIVSCSVVIPGWGDGGGGGPVNEQLSRVLTKHDTIFVAATGNLAERHWRIAPEATVRTATVRTTPGTAVSLDLCSSVGTDRIRFAKTPERVRYHALPNGGHATRWLATGEETTITIEHVRGEQGTVRLTVMGATISQATRDGSIVFPGENPSVWAIGAVDERGQRCSYSGCGTITRSPDLMAVVPIRTTARIEPFAGTSAAVPQGAGCVALLLSQQPSLRSREVRRYFAAAALDVGPSGLDRETGNGQLRILKP